MLQIIIYAIYLQRQRGKTRRQANIELLRATKNKVVECTRRNKRNNP